MNIYMLTHHSVYMYMFFCCFSDLSLTYFLQVSQETMTPNSPRFNTPMISLHDF